MGVLISWAMPAASRPNRFELLRQLQFDHDALALLHFRHQLILQLLLLARFLALGRDIGADGDRVGEVPRLVE